MYCLKDEKILVSRDVIFFENEFPYQSRSEIPPKLISNQSSSHNDLFPTLAPSPHIDDFPSTDHADHILSPSIPIHSDSLPSPTQTQSLSIHDMSPTNPVDTSTHYVPTSSAADLPYISQDSTNQVNDTLGSQSHASLPHSPQAPSRRSTRPTKVPTTSQDFHIEAALPS